MATSGQPHSTFQQPLVLLLSSLAVLVVIWCHLRFLTLFDIFKILHWPNLREIHSRSPESYSILVHCHFSNCEPQTDVQHHAAEHDDPLISCNTSAPQRMLATLLLHDRFRGKSSGSLLIRPKQPTCCFINGYEVQYIPLLN